jgi:uncharacterized membrane protein
MAMATPSTAAQAMPRYLPAVRRIRLADLRQVLAQGWQDFLAAPTQLVFLSIIYPVVGLVLGRAADDGQLLPMLFPLAAGFVLLGPLAALGVYELSRRREAGLSTTLGDALSVVRAPGIGAVASLGVGLMGLFVAWMITARLLWHGFMGASAPASIPALLAEVLGSEAGLRLMLVGNLVGLGFAMVVLAIAVVSFPLLLDRNRRGQEFGAMDAARTSLRAVRANPAVMATWGLIVAVLLLLGSLPLFVGLAVVLPVLGHATWHLYRKVVV